MDLKSSKLQRAVVLNRRYLWVGIVFLLIASIFFGWAYTISQEDLGEPISMLDAVMNEEIEDGTYVSLSVTSLPELFAEYDESLTSAKYYFLWDDHYLYVGYLDYDTYQYLNDESISLENPKVIEGKTKTLTTDVIDIAIDYYNDAVGEEFLTFDNYSEYIGHIFIDLDTPLHDYDTQLIVGFIFGIVSVVFFILFFVLCYKLKKSICVFSDTEWNKIIKELDDDDTKFYKQTNIYLTKHYMVDLNRGITVLDYEDIVWIYQYRLKQYGITTAKSLIVCTKNRKKYKIADSEGFSRTKAIYEEIVKKIQSVQPNVMIGFTKENKNKAKDLYQIK